MPHYFETKLRQENKEKTKHVIELSFLETWGDSLGSKNHLHDHIFEFCFKMTSVQIACCPGREKTRELSERRFMSNFNYSSSHGMKWAL